jgi:hypothetical protein
MAKNKMCDLRDHLFDTLERLKSNNDPNTDENEKIDIETAKAIVDVSSAIIETFKIETQAIGIISKSQNSTLLTAALSDSGIFSQNLKSLPQ